ncbi:unnamed protein product [Spirodela intermedia]|uniref:Uncharacterized protein n=1 Tax=Spirodela intermedia TaxID=51605 RepID=A0A7I8JRN7_SPIIN|nr:unnamed protein product [Spirodela intermedia]CAA6672846.1 unnamed protein product [Spirodela intermedia]
MTSACNSFAPWEYFKATLLEFLFRHLITHSRQFQNLLCLLYT